MHFTREPIIESVITPREGCRITLRNSKNNSQEEYIVEAVEVVSFGNALFFRSLEKPKAFLLPVNDYEIVETKETRVILKSISLEKSIKIGGGREGPVRATKEQPTEREEEENPSRTELAEGKVDKRRNRRRRRRSSDERQELKEWTEKKEEETQETAGTTAAFEGGGALHEETFPPVSSPMLTALIPPPSTLISETIARYKDATYVEGALLSKSLGKNASKEEQAPQLQAVEPSAQHEGNSEYPEPLLRVPENEEKNIEDGHVHSLNEEKKDPSEETVHHHIFDDET